MARFTVGVINEWIARHVSLKAETESSSPAFFKDYYLNIVIGNEWAIEIDTRSVYDAYFIIFEVNKESGEIEIVSSDYYEFEGDGKFHKRDFPWDEVKLKKDIGFIEIDRPKKLHITISRLPKSSEVKQKWMEKW